MENFEFFTGLPPGRKHEKMVAEGRDFIIMNLDPSDENLVCMPDPGKQALSQLLREVTWSEWVRVRAMTLEEAQARFLDAVDQMEAKNNGSPSWQKAPLYSWDRDAAARERIIYGGK